ncbi:hypothetical protein SUGI_0110320 [Cryptomeria japonica]|uniref:protein TPR1 isoform X2 n=1 Tax=Cryptomeria japonica TaxID=3369 RepID=UPI002408AF43|nr:protein TPR1 isoform X2 [Cryptomeria japonica]GLJ09472.1 hypothetical protein SUGI_0110320 [Cryptomeria japonica]
MTSLSRELVFLILQFLDEEKFKESVHKLEQESGFYFNMKYFEDKAMAGEWDEVERYLSGFTKVDDNRYSMKIFFEIRKQKYLEALDRQDRAKAVDILVNDLRVFSTFNEDLYKEITQLLTLNNFRENEQLSKYGETKSARSIMLLELKKLIEANPSFREKLAFPNLKASRLRTLINQSLNWQHQLCKNPRPNPDIKTLFTDHACGPPNGTRTPTQATASLAGGLPKTPFPPIGGPHGPFQPVATATNTLASWMSNPTVVTSAQPSVAVGTIPIPSNQVSLLKRPRTPPTSATLVDYQTADSEPLMKRVRPIPQSIEEVTYPGCTQRWSLEDLPRTVAQTLNQGHSVTSMDFHPSQQTLLLVGTGNGEITLWEVSSKEKLASRPFKIWDVNNCSNTLQDPYESSVSSFAVNRVIWSPDGSLIGVAFSKHFIHVYGYQVQADLRQHLEIDAHVGGVNDLAFSHPNKQLCIITCGDDKMIKVWDALTGRKIYNFEGHEAAVYSVCPHHKESIQFIFSTAIDGKIKAWLYDNAGSRVDYDAPGKWCTTMMYSADGTRLFSCGTSKDGESFLVEWMESEGAIKRTYTGFRKKNTGVVQFDTTQNHFLAVGDDHQIKFWDMDNTNILTAVDAEGGLPTLPRLRFNKEGSLLAVNTADNGIKILANADGHRLLRTIENRPFDGSSRLLMDPTAIKVSGGIPIVAASAATSSATDRTEHIERVSPTGAVSGMSGVDPAQNSEKPRAALDDVSEKIKPWKLAEIIDPTQCWCITLPEAASESACKVSRLLYTNNGVGLLALGSNAVHTLWKWSRQELNPSGKATASIPPQRWQPSSGLQMTNDITDTNPEEAVPCIALSKNDSYVMSASGGKVSLFNMMTFKVMTTFMPPPPAPTFLAFHPQDNNIIAIGMEDSSIHIYNVRVDEVKTKLQGHQKRITGLAFSNSQNVLVSSGGDAQLCVWNTETWEKRKSKFIQLPPGKPVSGDTRVQFHSDQLHILVVHETQLVIYDAYKLEQQRQWSPQGTLPAPISYGTYSHNSLLIFASFYDGSIGVFDAETLRLRCRIAPTAYLNPGVNSQGVFPLVIAAHPSEPNQFALGLADGAVKVLEPSEAGGQWGLPAPSENGTLTAIGAGTSTSNHGSEQVPR